MRTNNTTRLAMLLLSASLGASALAQQPPAPPEPPQPPAAAMDHQGPDGPRGSHDTRRTIVIHHGDGMEGTMGIVPPGMWWQRPDVVQQVGLSPDQVKRIDDIFQKSRLQLIDLKANVERQNLLLEPLLNANPVDQDKAMAQIDKVASARAELEKANAKMLLGIRGVLSPDQWTKLQSRPERGFGPHGPMHGGPGE